MAKIFIINDTSVTAGADSTSDLGSSSVKWVDGYFSGTITAGSMSVSGLFTVGTLSASGAVIGASGSFSNALTCGTLSASGAVIGNSGSIDTLFTFGTASGTGAIIAASGSISGLVTVGTLSASGALIAVGSSTFGEFLITDGKNVSLGEANGTTFGTTTAQKLSFYGATAIVQATALTAKVGTVTASDPTTPDYAIQDLTNTSPYGFVTADEGQSLLQAVINLQTRVDELETRLQNLGLIA